jgi:hypothetical protein
MGGFFLEEPAKGKGLFDLHSSMFVVGWLVMEIPWLFQLLLAIGPLIPATGGSAAFAAFQRVCF